MDSEAPETSKLIDRIAAKIAKQKNCVRAFPCAYCDDQKDPFDGAGCRVLAFAALSGCIPDPTNNPDDDVRAVRVAIKTCGDPALVIDVVEAWIETALTDD